MVLKRISLQIIGGFTLLLLASACDAREPDISPIVSEIFSETCKTTNADDHIQVSASRATETVNILMVLSIGDNWPYGNVSNPVHEDILKTFRWSRRHKAVQLTRDLRRGKNTFIAPTHISGFLAYDQGFKWAQDPSHYLSTASGLSETFADDYLDALNQFYVSARVGVFLRKHQGIYKAALQGAREAPPSIEDIQALEMYYGTSAEAYCTRVSLALYSMAVSIDGSLGRDDIALMIIGPFTGISELEKQNGFSSKQHFKSLAFHEYGHSFFSDLSETLLQKSRSLYRPTTELNRKSVYGSWHTSLEEHIIRAAEIRIWEALGEPEIAEDTRRKNADFPYLPIIEELLIDYENTRDEYPTLNSYLPTLVNELVAKVDTEQPAN